MAMSMMKRTGLSGRLSSQSFLPSMLKTSRGLGLRVVWPGEEFIKGICYFRTKPVSIGMH